MSIPSLSSHLIASARCYRHDYLVMDRRSTATLICDGAARSCFHKQASLSRSVIGLASSPGGGSKQIADSRVAIRPRALGSRPAPNTPFWRSEALAIGVGRVGGRRAGQQPGPSGRTGLT
jgi:hypothetical protein